MKSFMILMALLITSICFSKGGKSSTSIAKITYNAEDGSTAFVAADKSIITKKNERFVEDDDKVFFEVININKQLYTVTIDGIVNNFNQSPNLSIGKFLSIEDIEQPSPTDAEELKTDDKSSNFIPYNFAGADISQEDIISKYKSKADEYYTAVSDLRTAITNLENSKDVLKYFTSTLEDCGLSIANIKANIAARKIAFSGVATFDDQIKALLLIVNTKASDEAKIFKELQSILKAYMENSEFQINNMSSNMVLINNKINKETAKKGDISKLNELHNLTRFLDKQKELLELNYNEYEEIHKIITTLMDSIHAYNYQDLAFALLNKYSLSQDDNNYIARSKSIEANGDQLEFTYSIKPKENIKHCTPSINIDKSIASIWVRRGWRAQFATGIGFNTIGMLNNSYRLTQVDSSIDNATNETVANFRIDKNRRTDLYIPNAVAYIHFVYRVKKYVSVGVSSAIAIDFKDFSSSNFDLGFVSSFGYKQSVAFILGIAFGKANVLDGKYEEGKVYKEGDFIDKNILTTSAFRPGLFFGISYNFASIGLGKK